MDADEADDLLLTDSQPSDDTELDIPDIPVYAQRQVIITSANAANIKGAVEESSMLHIRCYAHTINLSVQKFVKTMDSSLVRIRTIAQFFHKSAVATASLTVCILS